MAMQQDFLTKLFQILQFPKEIRERFREDLKEIIMANLTSTF